MYTFLPDEILKEILTPALAIPDQLFSCTERNSPFTRFSERSTSDYLLVCKDWLRVATPLLYGVVILRSKGQTQALEWALKSTPALGGFIKKVRIESGFCFSLYHVLKAAVNLTDLCLSLEVYSCDSISGISKGLQCIQPTRVIFGPDLTSRCQKKMELHVVVADAIPKWTKLEDVVIAVHTWPWAWQVTNPDIASIVSGLQKNKSVSSIRVTSSVNEYLAKDLLKISKARQFWIEKPTKRLEELVKGNPKLSKLVIFGDLKKAKPAPQAQKTAQTLTVLGRFTSLPDRIWKIILSHAVGNSELQDTDYADRPLSLKEIHKPSYRRNLALSCRRFYKIILPLYYECTVIISESDLTSLERFLSRSKKGKLLKTLFIAPLPYFWNTRKDVIENSIAKIFSTAPNLRRVLYLDTPKYDNPIRPINWDALNTLSSKAGPRLLDLQLVFGQGPSRTEKMNILTRFRALKNLSFSGGLINFDQENIPVDGLPHLEFLNCTTSNNRFLLMMTVMNLPRIKSVRFPTITECSGAPTFLRKHGHKLETLEIGFLAGLSVFDTCCNLRTFILPEEENGLPVAEFFSTSEEHPLEVLHIKTRDVRSSTKTALMEKFGYLDDVDLSNFTSLLHMKIDHATWPTNERTIKNSVWVRWAEHFKETYDMDVYDERGQAWVPRVKPKTRKRK